jgi:zinc protease
MTRTLVAAVCRRRAGASGVARPFVLGLATLLATLLAMLLAGSVVRAQTDGHPPRPSPGPAPAVRIPKIQMRTLRNGIRVAVLEDHEFPVVTVSAQVVAPDLLDPPGKEGVAQLTAQMLAEGTATRSADQIANAAAGLGTNVGATGFFTITRYFAPSLDLMADQLLHPAFPQESIDRLTANAIAGLERLKDQSAYLATRVLDNVVYGAGHPYARTPTKESYSAITRADLAAFHHDYYRPRNTTFVVAGDVTPAQAVAALDRAFGQWEGGGKAGDIAPPVPAGPGATRIYLYDRPTSPQSALRVGELGPPRDSKDYFALDMLNTILGGAFNSRLNLTLREVHGYTYGARSGFLYRPIPQPSTFTAGADVSASKTDSAVTDLVDELRAIRSTRPPTDSEVSFARRAKTLSLPLEFATVPAIAGAAATLLAYHLPLDYYDHVTANYERVTMADVRAAADKYLDPDHMAIIVVGDRKLIEPALEAAHVAPIVTVDLQAKPTS